MKKLFSTARKQAATLGMVSPRVGNVTRLIQWWGLHLYLWSGKPLRGPYRRTLFVFALALRSILHNQGVNSLILRMKVSLIAVQQYLSGNPLTSTVGLGCRIRLSHGLPYWLPVTWRAALRSKNLWVTRIVLSVLNSFKAFKGIYEDPSFASIRSIPFEGDLSDWKAFIPKFWKFANYQGIQLFWFHQPLFILTAGPNSALSFFGAARDAKAWQAVAKNHAKAFFEATGRFEYSMMMDLLATRAFPLPGEILKLGKLSLRYEAAGKIRVFAICDYWTQAALYPMHLWIFRILSGIPTDGTFDQDKALKTLVETPGLKEFYCYDLKSATDIIPIQLYLEVFSPILGRPLAELWVQLLVDRDYHLPDDHLVGGKDTVRYSRGQPMGAYSSWAGLATVHHCLVQFSAMRVGRGLPFLLYRVLGDDIVIADAVVAAEYIRVCEEFGIQVSFSKSFTSKEGFLNFANQTYLNQDNLSPASLKELLVAKKLGFNAQRELASRLLRRGWVDAKLPNVLRLLCPPSLWERVAKYSFNNLGRKISPSMLKLVRGALWPIGPFGDLVGTQSSLLVRGFVQAVNRPSFGLLTAHDLPSLLQKEEPGEVRALYEWIRQTSKRLKKLHVGNASAFKATNDFFVEVSERLDVGPLLTTVLWPRDGKALQRANRILEELSKLEQLSKVPTSIEVREAIVIKALELERDFPTFPPLGDWESIIALREDAGIQTKGGGALSRQVKRLQTWFNQVDGLPSASQQPLGVVVNEAS